MSDFRARDADRDRAVELLEAAHADGRLGAEDHDLRVARARSAESLDELRALTRDLLTATARPGPGPAPAYGAARPTAQRQARSGQWLVGLVIAVVALLALGVASTLLVSSSSVSGPESSTSPAEESVSAPAQGAGFEMTPRQVRTFLRRYEAEFGTLDSYSVVFSPSRVIVEVPVRAKAPRYDRWLYDGTFRRLSEASAVRSSAEVFDLGPLGVGRLFENITTARRTLRVDGGTLTHVVVHHWKDEAASVNIHVANTFDETARLATTVAGDRIVRRSPFRP